MKLKLTWLLTLFMAFVMQFSFAQDKTVTGTVTTADDGLPLPGASVIVKGTSRGQQTDFDGKYSISVNVGDVLVISYVGMKNAEIAIGSASTYNVALELDNALDEVVVVGYGTTTKQSYTGTATTVKAENIETKNFSNVSQALAGEASGVNVINTSGQPGTTSQVRIRGFGSINGNRAPLYVVDGVPYSGSLNAINPSDIKSTTILKDAVATAIYGSRGTNGVILITTKSGSSTESSIDVELRTGVNTQMIPRYDIVRSPEEYIGYAWEGIYGRGVATGEADPVGYANQRLFTDNYVAPGYNMWNATASELIDPATRSVRPGVSRRYTPLRYEDVAINDAYRTQVDLRMSGGDENTRYFLSGGYLNDEGVIINSGYKRYSTRLNVNSNVKEWLKVGANLGYTYSESIQNGQTDGAENLFEFADKMAPIFPVFLRDNNYQLVPDPIYGGNQYDYGTVSGFRARPNANNLNPVASALYDFAGSDRHELNGSFNFTIDIAKGLTFETTLGGQYYNNTFRDARNPFYGGGVSNAGDLFLSKTEFYNLNFLQLLRYKKDFGDHSLEAFIAHESNEFKFAYHTSYKGQAVIDGLYELDNYIENLTQPVGFSEGRNLESFFGQVSYDFKDTYYFSFSARRDGSSRFQLNPWQNYFSLGGAWVLSNESFLSGNDFLTFLKLKGSYGTTGDEQLNNYYFGANQYTAGILDGGLSLSLLQPGDPTITWESAVTWQVGVEFSLGTFLEANVDYFVKDTKDLFFNRRLPLSTGVSSVLVNDGELRNYGLEFDVTAHLVNSQDFKLDLTVNGAAYNNEITKMFTNSTTGEEEILAFSGEGPYGLTNGGSLYDFLLREWAGVDPANGAPLWYQYYDDVNANGIFDDGDAAIQTLPRYVAENENANIERQVTDEYALATNKFVGKSVIPTMQGAFRLAANYKNWNLSTQFTYQFGGYGYDGQYAELMQDRFGAVGNNFHRDISARWQNPGDITSVPRLADGLDQNSISTSTRFLTKTDYLALNNILLGYTLSSKALDKTGLDMVNIYVSGDNLFINTARDGYNPSTRQDGSSGRALYAPLTTFTLGVKLKF
jgi:TonB-linked SusC/RagA family outer membrane protein